MYVCVSKYINMTVSTENAAAPTSTKTRNTNSSVQIQITEASRDMKLPDRKCSLELGQFLHCALETRWQRFGQFLNDL